MREILLIAHFVMMSMGVGMVVSHYIMLRASEGHEGESGRALALARRTLGDVTTIVVVFIWITGAALLFSQYGQSSRQVSAWFYAKIAFVGLFTAAHIMQRLAAARWSGDLVTLRRNVERWVSIAWLSALLALCFAVISFESRFAGG